MDSATLHSSSTPASATAGYDRAAHLLAAPAESEAEFFALAAEALTVGLGCGTAGVALLSRDGGAISVRALWTSGHLGTPFTYATAGSPCAEVYAAAREDSHVCIESGVAERFPEFAARIGVPAESYRGEAFSAADGTVAGHLFAIGAGVHEDDVEARAFFELVRRRVGAEYRRWRADERRANYERTISLASDYIAIVDLSYGYRTVNPAYLEAFSWEAGGILPRSVSELHGPRSFESSIRPILDRCFEGEKVHTHGWFDMPTRKRQFLDIAAVPHREGGSEITGAIVSMRNLTALRLAQQERRGLETRLEQSRKVESLGLMAAGMAHDFNNLLVGMLGGADLLLTEELTEDGQRTARTIKQTALQASELCRRMLAYTGQAAQEPAPVDLSELTRETVATFAGALPDRVAVELELRPDMPLVDLDSQEVTQVIRSVILNAAEAYEGRSGTVQVATGATRIDHSFLDRILVDGDVQPGEFLFVQVRDSGCGVDPDTRSRIFDPFFSTKPAARGLGLSATRGILRAHSGCVQFETQTGVGTTVRLFFPVPAETIEALAPDSSKSDSQVRRILVIDDDPMVQEITRKMLEKAGLQTLSATSASEGETIFSARCREVDAVLLDARIPGRPVGELVDRLLTLDPTARIVLCSTSSAKDPELALLFAKSYGFLAKPFSSEVLLQKVEDTIAQRSG